MENFFKVLDVRIDAVEIPEIIEQINSWISSFPSGPAKYICVTSVHGVMGAQKNSYLKKITNESSLSVSDGMPIVWLAKLKGFKSKKRVYGLKLMEETFKVAEKKGYANYFYGSTEPALQKLLKSIRVRYPELKISGTYSPPFRDLNGAEKEEVIKDINDSGADIIWVGLGYPKQEIWMYEFKDLIKPPVLIGVGAAFDFFSGNKKRAPTWMQNLGLEWLFRLVCEPRRLWKRYLVNNSLFILLIIKESILSIFLLWYNKKLNQRNKNR